MYRKENCIGLEWNGTSNWLCVHFFLAPTWCLHSCMNRITIPIKDIPFTTGVILGILFSTFHLKMKCLYFSSWCTNVLTMSLTRWCTFTWHAPLEHQYHQPAYLLEWSYHPGCFPSASMLSWCVRLLKPKDNQVISKLDETRFTEVAEEASLETVILCMDEWNGDTMKDRVQSSHSTLQVIKIHHGLHHHPRIFHLQHWSCLCWTMATQYAMNLNGSKGIEIHRTWSINCISFTTLTGMRTA